MEHSLNVLVLTATEVTGLVLITGAILALLAIMEAARHLFALPEEFSRKGVHLGTGIIVFAVAAQFPRAAPVVLIAGVFTVLNLLAYHRGWLRAVHHAGRRSHGTVYYPLALFILAAALWDTAPGIVAGSILVLAVGDGLAGIAGELLRAPHTYTLNIDSKSREGSLAMFLGSLAALHAGLFIGPGFGPLAEHMFVDTPILLFLTLAVVSAAATAAEALTPYGLDNLSVPLLTALLLYMSFGAASPFSAAMIVEASVLGGLIAAASFRVRILSASGAVAAYLLAVIVFGVGGWIWTAPIVGFFLLSSALSRAGSARKHRFEGLFEKSSTRDAGQVAANGGVAGFIAILSIIFPAEQWYVIYLGSLAAVTADTWGTELGVLAGKPPFSIITFRRIATGSSGGISVPGTLGGMLGACLIAAIGLAVRGWDAASPALLLLLTASGAAGSIIDSLLGATLQAQYRCGYCGGVTEKPLHCHLPATRVRGLRWFNNDTVNIACALTGALVAALLT